MMAVENSRNLTLLIIFHLLILTHGLAVSPKLDFGDSSGLVEVKKDIKTGKIKGLRVTVDTSELKESKSSGSESSSSDSSETKKTVGVRTDVTFEITSGEVNDTKTVDEKEIGKDDDNASIPVVPVFKGTADRGGSNNGNNKDSSYNEILSVIPLENPAASQQPPARGPIFHNTHDDGNRYGGGSSDDSWKIPQYAIWTTERYNRRFDHHPPVFHHRGPIDIYKKPSSNFIPYPIHHHDGNHQIHQHDGNHQIHHDTNRYDGNRYDGNQQIPHHGGSHPHLPWQPCACKEYPGPYIQINPNQQQQPSSNEFKQTNKVDDKLERPFSKTS